MPAAPVAFMVSENRPQFVNDVHAQLNATPVRRIITPSSTDEVANAVCAAAREGRALSWCGARHAMGGQQFGTDTVLLDLRGLKQLGDLDRRRGLVEAGAGLTWPELIAGLEGLQPDDARPWSIRQKQTGADDLTLGGALAANIHGRGLRMRPFIADIAAFTLVDAAGATHRCSRTENTQPFRLAIGGYGCFGAVTSIRLRLDRRHKLERIVDVIDVADLVAGFDQRRREGCTFGDFQFAIDARSPDFLRRGVFSCYRPVANDRPIPETQRELCAADWERLVHLAHTEPTRAFNEYAAHYRATHGQIYWSDRHQLSPYLPHYHARLDGRLGAAVRATEVIGELHVPRPALSAFMARAADALRAGGVPVIYGTIRLIERDGESFLAWARDDFACVIFNLHTEHTPPGIARTAGMFRVLIDLALSLGGSFYLTYHRWARRDQIDRAYPQFRAFLREKQKFDPHERLQSDWWRHHRDLFAASRQASSIEPESAARTRGARAPAARRIRATRARGPTPRERA